MRHSEKLAATWREQKRLLFKAIFYLVFSVGILVTGGGSAVLVWSLNPDKLWQLGLPVLAVFYAFSSLMFNRARALEDGPERRRSLYSAERALQATVLAIAGFALAGYEVGFLLSWMERLPSPVLAEVPIDQALLAVPSGVVFGCSWASFCFAIQAVSHRVFMWQRPRTVLRRLRQRPTRL